MRVLIGCECSGTVRDAFLKQGHDAYSCDIKRDEHGSNRHFVADILEAIDPANQHIFAVLQRVATDANFRLSVPPAKLCTDNAAMIAWAALERFERPDDLAFAPSPRWPLDPEASPPPGRGVRQ